MLYISEGIGEYFLIRGWVVMYYDIYCLFFVWYLWNFDVNNLEICEIVWYMKCMMDLLGDVWELLVLGY